MTPCYIREEIGMQNMSALKQRQYLHIGSNERRGNIGFREPDILEELPCNEDIIMNIGELNHRFI